LLWFGIARRQNNVFEGTIFIKTKKRIIKREGAVRPRTPYRGLHPSVSPDGYTPSLTKIALCLPLSPRPFRCCEPGIVFKKGCFSV